MKNLIIIFVAHLLSSQLQAQHFVVGNDKMNIAYLGIDNPITVAVENVPCNRIVLKAENGTITGAHHKFIFRGKEVGAAYITVYEKTAKHLKKIGQYPLRVKRLPAPSFKIGPYGSTYSYSKRKANTVVLAAQEYARAELGGFDFEYKCSIDSFSVKIIHFDSGKATTFINFSNKISQEIRNAFSELKNGDIIFFNKIFSTCPDKIQIELDPLVLTIDQ